MKTSKMETKKLVFEQIFSKLNMEYVDDNICVIKQDIGHYCGYVLLPESPIIMDEYGYVNINVHGGVTYDKWITVDNVNYLLLGFDCAHLDDDKNKSLQNLDYLIEITRKFYEDAKEYEKGYKIHYKILRVIYNVLNKIWGKIRLFIKGVEA